MLGSSALRAIVYGRPLRHGFYLSGSETTFPLLLLSRMRTFVSGPRARKLLIVFGCLQGPLLDARRQMRGDLRSRAFENRSGTAPS